MMSNADICNFKAKAILTKKHIFKMPYPTCENMMAENDLCAIESIYL